MATNKFKLGQTVFLQPTTFNRDAARGGDHRGIKPEQQAAQRGHGAQHRQHTAGRRGVAHCDVTGRRLCVEGGRVPLTGADNLV